MGSSIGPESDPSTGGGGGSTFPTYTSAGSPEGVQSATKGQTYQDSTTGALYLQADVGPSTTGWVILGGAASDINSTAGLGTILGSPDQMALFSLGNIAVTATGQLQLTATTVLNLEVANALLGLQAANPLIIRADTDQPIELNSPPILSVFTTGNPGNTPSSVSAVEGMVMVDPTNSALWVCTTSYNPVGPVNAVWFELVTGAGSGSVTSVSVATANGFAGTVATPTSTPAITVQTSITGVLKGNGTAISAASAGTDYVIPSGNISGTAGNLSGTPALPNGTTATTQTAGDNTTKLATDAFVTTAVTNAIAGVNPAIAVSAATTAAADTSAWTYANGASGVGATFTGPVNTAITIDGFTFTTITSQSLLVKNDTQSPSGAFNGIYVLTALQTAGTGAIFTRRLDYDTPSDMNNTGSIPVVSGTANGTTSWVLTSNITTVGTSPLTFTKFTINPSTIQLGPLTGDGTTSGAVLTVTGINGAAVSVGQAAVIPAGVTLYTSENAR